jgi:hypothetical protein
MSSAVAQTGQTAFQNGHADRQAWESWFGGLSGTYRAGAEFWASHRNDPDPPDCSSTNDVAFRSGCQDATKQLSNSDYRRKQNAEYKAGWNSPVDTSATATAQPGPSKPEEPEAVPPPSHAAEAQSSTSATPPSPSPAAAERVTLRCVSADYAAGGGPTPGSVIVDLTRKRMIKMDLFYDGEDVPLSVTSDTITWSIPNPITEGTRVYFILNRDTLDISTKLDIFWGARWQCQFQKGRI